MAQLNKTAAEINQSLADVDSWQPVQIVATEGQQVFSALAKKVYANKNLVFINDKLLFTGVVFNSDTEIEIPYPAAEGDVITIK